MDTFTKITMYTADIANEQTLYLSRGVAIDHAFLTGGTTEVQEVDVYLTRGPYRTVMGKHYAVEHVSVGFIGVVGDIISPCYSAEYKVMEWFAERGIKEGIDVQSRTLIGGEYPEWDSQAVTIIRGEEGRLCALFTLDVNVEGHCGNKELIAVDDQWESAHEGTAIVRLSKDGTTLVGSMVEYHPAAYEDLCWRVNDDIDLIPVQLASGENICWAVWKGWPVTFYFGRIDDGQYDMVCYREMTPDEVKEICNDVPMAQYCAV